MSLTALPAPVRRWLPLATVGSLAVAATVVLHHVDPYAAGNPLPGCPMYALTGLYCPGCGSTRCLYSLVHFDLPGALAMNPLLLLCLPLLLLMLLNNAGVNVPGTRPLIRLLAKPMFWLIVLVGYAVLRNLPWAPFTLLAPIP